MGYRRLGAEGGALPNPGLRAVTPPIVTNLDQYQIKRIKLIKFFLAKLGAAAPLESSSLSWCHGTPAEAASEAPRRVGPSGGRLLTMREVLGPWWPSGALQAAKYLIVNAACYGLLPGSLARWAIQRGGLRHA